ncbi:UNVERIFIED_CONTAM: hypothetical protein Slati_2648200 [Sesamum latifolium]|uniref:DUF8040 domain-containing protein n=1 Tax=Sesamum latifolium TaxID=2727402 RepID=A0AAW2VW43_9LAMI
MGFAERLEFFVEIQEFITDSLRMLVLLYRYYRYRRAQLRVNRPRRLLKYSLRNRVPQQMIIMRRLTKINDVSCLDNLRTRNAFGRLCHILHEMGCLRDSKHVSVHEQVVMFLSVLAHNKKNRTVKYDFNGSGRTVNRYFHKVLNVVLHLHPLLLAKPTPVRSNSNCSRWRWFEGCLGALDETYIDVRVRTNDKARYRTRKGSIAVNVLGVCDRDLNFIYVLSGWECSAADSRVLRDAMNRDNSLKISKGCYYLYDNGQAMPIGPFENMVVENVSSSDRDNIEYLISVDANPAWTTWRDELARLMYNAWRS